VPSFASSAVANPDVVTVDTTKLVPMPGQCGVWYAEYGGPPAILMGKPATVIYEAAKKLCGGRTLAVGDSLAHDIAGACGAGIDSLFVANGLCPRLTRSKRLPLQGHRTLLECLCS
jgi:ribonucleotide monophosphatase NagD (HAD superfamily)